MKLLLALSGTHTGESYTFDTRTLSLIFETDNHNTFDGWELDYTAGYVGINELRITNYELRVYPNPTKGQLRIACGRDVINHVSTVEIYSVVGQKLNNYQFSILN